MSQSSSCEPAIRLVRGELAQLLIQRAHEGALELPRLLLQHVVDGDETVCYLVADVVQHLLPGVLAREQAGAVHDGLYLFRRGDDVVEVVQDGLDAVPELGVGLFPLQAPVVHSLAQLRGHAVEAALALLRRLHAQQAVGIHRAEGGQLGEEGAQLLLRGRLLGVDRLQIGPVYGVHVLHQGVQHGDGEVVTDGVLVAHVHHAAAGDGELGLGYAVQEGLDGFVVLPAVVVHEVEEPQARVPVAEFVAQAVVKLDVRLLHTADWPGDDEWRRRTPCPRC